LGIITVQHIELQEKMDGLMNTFGLMKNKSIIIGIRRLVLKKQKNTNQKVNLLKKAEVRII